MINQVKKICQTYGIKPERSKGQNFLVNQKVLDKIVQTAAIKKTDTVLEVGPGLGILTEALVKKAKRVVSVELDQKLFSFLKAQFINQPNLDLINYDILKFNPSEYNLKKYKIVANLPYNITSRFLKNFLTNKSKPESMVLLLQKEVAERVCAQAGKMSLLALSVQLYGQPEIIEIVERQNFWPEPQVDSAILKINNIKSATMVAQWLSEVAEKQFWQLLKVGFSAKRKKLANNLVAGLKIDNLRVKKALVQAGLVENIRAQNLNLDDWLRLAKKLKMYLN